MDRRVLKSLRSLLSPLGRRLVLALLASPLLAGLAFAADQSSPTTYFAPKPLGDSAGSSKEAKFGGSFTTLGENVSVTTLGRYYTGGFDQSGTGHTYTYTMTGEMKINGVTLSTSDQNLGENTQLFGPATHSGEVNVRNGAMLYTYGGKQTFNKAITIDGGSSSAPSFAAFIGNSPFYWNEYRLEYKDSGGKETEGLAFNDKINVRDHSGMLILGNAGYGAGSGITIANSSLVAANSEAVNTNVDIDGSSVLYLSNTDDNILAVGNLWFITEDQKNEGGSGTVTPLEWEAVSANIRKASAASQVHSGKFTGSGSICINSLSPLANVLVSEEVTGAGQPANFNGHTVVFEDGGSENRRFNNWQGHTYVSAGTLVLKGDIDYGTKTSGSSSGSRFDTGIVRNIIEAAAFPYKDGIEAELIKNYTEIYYKNSGTEDLMNDIAENAGQGSSLVVYGKEYVNMKDALDQAVLAKVNENLEAGQPKLEFLDDDTRETILGKEEYEDLKDLYDTYSSRFVYNGNEIYNVKSCGTLAFSRGEGGANAMPVVNVNTLTLQDGPDGGSRLWLDAGLTTGTTER